MRDRIARVRRTFDSQLAEVLVGRPDLSLIQIAEEFRVSQSVIRRVMKQFSVGARRRGAKRKKVDVQRLLGRTDSFTPDGAAGGSNELLT